MASVTDHTFKTSDTPLAAYLLTEGFVLLDIDYSEHRAVFVFSNDTVKMEECIRAYHTVRAEGNIVTFFNNYKTLVRRIRNNA